MVPCCTASRLEAVGRVEQVVGHEEGVGAQSLDGQILHRVVAHHEHVFAGKAARRHVLGVVGQLRLHRRGVLERRDALEAGRIDARPRQAPFHGASREHGHGGQHERVALRRQRLDGARSGRIGLEALADGAEIVLVEPGEQLLPPRRIAVGVGEERLPERVEVRAPVVVRGHGADARLEAGRERGGVKPVGRHEPRDGLEVRAQELVELHGQQRAVQVEEDCAIRARCHGVDPLIG